MLLWTAFLILVIAALGGAGNAVARLRGRNPPIVLAIGHGVVAAAGIVTLAVYAAQSGWPRAALAPLIALVIAAALGVSMAITHRRGQLISPGLVIGHATIALAGLLLVLAAAVAKPVRLADPDPVPEIDALPETSPDSESDEQSE